MRTFTLNAVALAMLALVGAAHAQSTTELNKVTVTGEGDKLGTGLLIDEDAPKARSSVTKAQLEKSRSSSNPYQALSLLPGCGQAPARNESAAPRPYRPPDTLPTANLDAGQTAIVDRIEREIRMPRGAEPLASYARYYAWQQGTGSSRTVLGSFMVGSDWQPGRYWTDENRLPMLVDGGCSRVTLSYNVATERVREVNCNGAID